MKKIFNRKTIVNRKAISPVIAVLLMIAIAVAASILVYVWSMGLIGTLQSGGGEQTTEQIIMEAYDWSNATALTMYVRNVGSSNVQIDAVYIEGSGATITPLNVNVGAGSTQLDVTPSASATYTAGIAYTVKVVTTSGGIFTFNCITGSAG